VDGGNEWYPNSIRFDFTTLLSSFLLLYVEGKSFFAVFVLFYFVFFSSVLL
jgi:hypothetical protein